MIWRRAWGSSGQSGIWCHQVVERFSDRDLCFYLGGGRIKAKLSLVGKRCHSEAGQEWLGPHALLCLVFVPLGTSWSDQQGCFLHFGSKQIAVEEVELQQWAKTHSTYPRTSILILALEPTQEQGTGGKVLGHLSM